MLLSNDFGLDHSGFIDKILLTDFHNCIFMNMGKEQIVFGPGLQNESYDKAEDLLKQCLLGGRGI